MDLQAVMRDYVDYLVPRLDTYEQALYIFILRRTHLDGSAEATIGFKSARKLMGFGVGEKGKPMSETTCSEKLKGLSSKGCLEILDALHDGTRIRLKLPAEIPGLIPAAVPAASELDLEEMDFFTVQSNRDAIFRREGARCFYCLRTLNKSNFIVEHVSARADDGGNGYRNVVAACRTCNNRKNAVPVEDFLRGLYREGLLSADDFANRTRAIERLRAGELKPVFLSEH